MAKDLITIRRGPTLPTYHSDEAWIRACNDIVKLRKYAETLLQHVRRLDHVDQHNRSVIFNLREVLETLRDPQIVIDYLQRLGYAVTKVLEPERDYRKKRGNK